MWPVNKLYKKVAYCGRNVVYKARNQTVILITSSHCPTIVTTSDDSEVISSWQIFTHESSYCFQLILAIAILSVRHTGGSVKNGAS